MESALINFTFDEMKITQLALLEMQRDMKEAHSDPRIPWTPEARQHQKEMRAAAMSAILKIAANTGLPTELPIVSDSDQLRFLTKPS